MPKKKAKKAKAPKIDLEIPKARGCLKCNRWADFMSKVWEAEHEICPESACTMISFVIKPEKTP